MPAREKKKRAISRRAYAERREPFFFAQGGSDASEHGTDSRIPREHAGDVADLAVQRLWAALLQSGGWVRELRFENGCKMAARPSPRTQPRTLDCARASCRGIKKGDRRRPPQGETEWTRKKKHRNFRASTVRRKPHRNSP